MIGFFRTLKRVAESYNKNTSLYFLIIYAVGYLKLWLFYSYFNVSIEYFISLTDILFSILKSAFIAVISVFLFDLYSELYRKSDFVTQVLKSSVWICILLFLTVYTDISMSIIWASYFVLLIVIIFVYPHIKTAILGIVESLNDSLTDIEKIDKGYSFSKTGIAIFSVFVFLLFYLISRQEINNVLEKKNSVQVEFCQDGRKFSTLTENYALVGETSSFVFLYYKKKKETLVFHKEDLVDLKFSGKSEILIINRLLERSRSFRLFDRLK